MWIVLRLFLVKLKFYTRKLAVEGGARFVMCALLSSINVFGKVSASYEKCFCQYNLPISEVKSVELISTWSISAALFPNKLSSLRINTPHSFASLIQMSKNTRSILLKLHYYSNAMQTFLLTFSANHTFALQIDSFYRHPIGQFVFNNLLFNIK